MEHSLSPRERAGVRDLGHFCDSQEHRFEILQDIKVGESQQSISLFSKQNGSCPVFLCSFRRIVLPTVQFNAQLFLVAIEVDDVPADWLLSSELQAEQPTVPQSRPEQRFRVGLFSPKSSDEPKEFDA